MSTTIRTAAGPGPTRYGSGRPPRNVWGPAGPASADNQTLGVSVAPLTADLVTRYKLPKETRGVIVREVNPDGRAADAGIQAGDVIEEVNRQAVSSVDELKAALRKTTDRPMLLLVNRQGDERFVTVRPSNG